MSDDGLKDLMRLQEEAKAIEQRFKDAKELKDLIEPAWKGQHAIIHELRGYLRDVMEHQKYAVREARQTATDEYAALMKANTPWWRFATTKEKQHALNKASEAGAGIYGLIDNGMSEAAIELAKDIFLSFRNQLPNSDENRIMYLEKGRKPIRDEEE